MPWWGWIVIGGMLLGSEILVTTEFYLAVLGAAALSVGLFAGLGLETAWMQWALFGFLSVFYLVAFRQRLARRVGTDEPDTPLLTGDIAIVQEEIAPGQTGGAELRGTRWSALNSGREPLEAGAQVRVEKIEGLTIHVRSEEEVRARRKHQKTS
jgi:membrane protein implicated in regulation of membrane protease activity